MNQSIRDICRRLVPAAAIVFLFAGILCLVKAWEEKNYAEDESAAAVDYTDDGRYLWYQDGWYAPRSNIKTLLLIGVDKFADEPADGYLNNQQCDFLVLLVLDRTADTVTALHINRDTMTNVPVLGVTGEYVGSSFSQIALAHTYGSGGKDSCRNTVDAVSNLLYDISIDEYAAITMDAVAILNDDVGGVPVTIEDDFTATDLGWHIGQRVTLTGSEALSFVRARGELEDSTNLRRMERQRAYSVSFRDRLKAALAADDTLSARILSDIGNYLVTDCTASQLERYCEAVSEEAFLGFVTIPGQAVKGDTYMEFHPDEDGFKQLLIELFYEPAEE